MPSEESLRSHLGSRGRCSGVTLVLWFDLLERGIRDLVDKWRLLKRVRLGVVVLVLSMLFVIC